MEKNKNKLISLLIILIFVGLLSLSLLSYKDSSGIIKSDMSNITKLVATNVYSEMQNEFIKPIFVSLTMANDSFLKGWVVTDSEKNIEQMTQYLTGIQNKYSYDSAFFVSNVTKNYYHFEGILKTISPDDEHDVWFYNFLDLDVEYNLVVDTDQASSGDLTLFVNCLTSDGDDILGVTGVGLKMHKIQTIIEQYQKEFDVEVFLINKDGIITIHTDENLIFNENIFDSTSFANIKEDILDDKSSLHLFEPTTASDNKYIASHYIEELDWYLIVSKNADFLQSMLITHQIKTVITYLTAFFFLALLTVYIIGNYHKRNLKLVKTDYLTDINNRMAFDDALSDSIGHAKAFNHPLTLAVIDIDDFKQVNDTYGHAQGDVVLKEVAQHLKSFIRSKDLLARWGGDEFSIIFSCDSESTKKILDRIVGSNQESSFLKKYNITLSIGVSQYKNEDTSKTLLERADKALYMAKKEGKNRVCEVSQ